MATVGHGTEEQGAREGRGNALALHRCHCDDISHSPETSPPQLCRQGGDSGSRINVPRLPRKHLDRMFLIPKMNPCYFLAKRTCQTVNSSGNSEGNQGTNCIIHPYSPFFSISSLACLEKEMAPHSSILAWRIPGTAEAGGLPSKGSHRVGHD